jgi:hypothetical protein
MYSLETMTKQEDGVQLIPYTMTRPASRLQVEDATAYR